MLACRSSATLVPWSFDWDADILQVEQIRHFGASCTAGFHHSGLGWRLTALVSTCIVISATLTVKTRKRA